jgi:predicted methyltransferase
MTICLTIQQVACLRNVAEGVRPVPRQRNVLDALVRKKLITQDNSGYHMTDAGRELLRRMGR